MAQLHRDILQKYWGYDQFRPLQEDIVESVYAGKDTLGLMPTGGGKSLTFQVPAMAMDGVCIVITPLIALMKDQVKNLRNKGIKATAIFSGMRRAEIIAALDNCIYGDYKFLYLSPERLESELFLKRLPYLNVSFITVDEAHCISQWGYDFRPGYLRICEFRKLVAGAPVLALTATATGRVIEDICEKLHFNDGNIFRKSYRRNNLSYVVRKTQDKSEEMLGILQKVSGSGIVYVRSRAKTKELAQWLSDKNISAGFFHAGLEPHQKDAAQEGWTNGSLRIIVATNAFGMGIDKADVRMVIHYDVPESPEAYFQEAGRAGRDGEMAYAVLLYGPSDSRTIKKRVTDAFPEREFIARIYQSLCNKLTIPIGSGQNSVFDFDMPLFCLDFKLPQIQTHNALKLLEAAGFIEYTDIQDSPSRIHFSAGKNELFHFENHHPEFSALLQVILRSYTGLFTEYVYFSEDLVASRLGTDRKYVYESLVYIDKMHIIKYVPRKKLPLIILKQPRTSMENIVIPEAVYEVMQDRMTQRMNAMLKYIDESLTCRENLLLEYFGEQGAEPCGICDICRSRKKARTLPFLEGIKQRILHTLQHGSYNLNDMLAAIPASKEDVLAIIRIMCDDGLIRFDASTLELTLDTPVHRKN